MPLVTSVVLAYAAGLLASVPGNAAWMAAALACVVALGVRSRDRLPVVAVAVAGFGIGAASLAEQDRCTRRARAAVEWEARLTSDAAPGALARATLSCGVAVRIVVAEGAAPAGAAVHVTGAAARSAGGVLVTGAQVEQTAPPRLLARWRAAVGRHIDATFRARAPLVRALLIADMSELTPAVRERFAAAGLSHMLSVSGLHVGLIAAAVLLLAQVAGARRGRAEAVAVGLTVAYVAAIGAPLPAVRAAIMLGAVALSRAVQRPTSAWATLACGAGLPLVQPHAITDVGYQLSVVGMVALVSAGALATRWEWLAVAGWRGTLYRGLTTSVLATLFTAPLVAAVFGQVSLVAPLTNLAAAPVMAVLQPMLFLAALAMVAAPVSRFVADACEPLLLAIDGVADIGSQLPGSAVPVLADTLSLGLACACVAALAVACVSRFPGRALLGAACACAVIAWRPAFPSGSGLTELHMLDVGQGDALALRTARGRWVLVDAGRTWDGGDAGRRVAVPYLARRGGRLDGFILSHAHADHVGGAASVLAALRPAWFLDAGYAGTSPPYRAALLAARGAGVRWQRARPGDSVVVDEAVITVLAPDSVWADTLADPNDASVVVRVRVGAVVLLFTGDAEAAEEEWLVARYGAQLRADVLKVAHHGSRTSSTAAFIGAVRPRVALVSVGAGNRYGHPDRAVLARLARSGAIVLRSDTHGAVVLRSDGRRLEVDAEGVRWTLP